MGSKSYLLAASSAVTSQLRGSLLWFSMPSIVMFSPFLSCAAVLRLFPPFHHSFPFTKVGKPLAPDKFRERFYAGEDIQWAWRNRGCRRELYPKRSAEKSPRTKFVQC